jgi:hypothetical protein
MDDDRNAWYKRYSKNFGPREFARFGCVHLLWMFFGAALSILLRLNQLFLFFLIVPFVFALVAVHWRPAYTLYRRILGNKNILTEPMPAIRVKTFFQERDWRVYIFVGLWALLIDLGLLYAVIKYLSK